MKKSGNSEPYQSKAIRALIDAKFDELRSLIVGLVMVPYILLLLLFFLYTVYDLFSIETVIDRGLEKRAKNTRIVMLVLMSYYAI